MWSSIRAKKESDSPLPADYDVHDDFWWIVIATFIAIAAIFYFFPPDRANAATPATGECRASSEAVYANHPRETTWASWSRRLPGHEGTKCYFATERANKHEKVRTAAPTQRKQPVRREPEAPVLEKVPAAAPTATKVTAAARHASAQAFDHAVENLMSPAKPDHAPGDFADRWDGATTRFSTVLGSSHTWKDTIGFLEVDGAHGRPLWALH